MKKYQIILKAKSVKGISGMTVNERLWSSGLINLFESSKINDPAKAREILEALNVDEKSINDILSN